MDEKLQESLESNEPTEQADDTEGHYLASYEYGRIVARERESEAERAARDARLGRERRAEKKR